MGKHVAVKLLTWNEFNSFKWPIHFQLYYCMVTASLTAFKIGIGWRGSFVSDFTFLKMNNLETWLEGQLFCVSICPGWTVYLKLSACFSLLTLPSCISLGLYPVSCFLKTRLLEQQSFSAAHLPLYLEDVSKEKWQEMEVLSALTST